MLLSMVAALFAAIACFAPSTPWRPILITPQLTPEATRAVMLDASTKRSVVLPFAHASWSRDLASTFLGYESGVATRFSVGDTMKLTKGRVLTPTPDSWNQSRDLALSFNGSAMMLRSINGKQAPRRIKTGRGEIIAAEISPNGRWIAFTKKGSFRYHPGNDPYQDLWIVGTDNRNLRRLGHGSRPRWSPNSEGILALEGSDDGRAVLVYVVKTGRYRKVLSADLEAFSGAAYSPDGLRIAILGSSSHPSHRMEVFLTDIKGRFLEVILDSTHIPKNGYGWSIDW